MELPRIGPRPTAGAAGQHPSSALPEDLQRHAVRRLSWITGFVTLGATAATILFLAVPALLDLRLERPLAPLLAGAALSALVTWMARSPRLPPKLVLRAGLAWLVGLVLIMAVFRHWVPYRPEDVVRGPSPTLFVVVFYAALVPTRPPHMAAVALAAAAMEALGLCVTVWGGNPWPAPKLLAWLIAPSVLAIPLSVVVSRVLFDLGRSVKAARELGSYRLTEVLGRGGMGEVWRAEHRMLARPAAVKLIRAEMLGAPGDQAAERTLARFEREAQATAALQSPHTVEVYDFGRADDGTFYYVMELLEGADVETLVQRLGPMPPERATSLLLMACHSLADAHAAGVIHRDVKPANVFVAHRRVDPDFVKLLDFGLVRPIEGHEEKLTVDGAIAGTPAFMAPEQATGDEYDHRADIYALGCVAFWMLTGETVFASPLPLQQLIDHARTPARRVSDAAPQPIPDALADLVARCLEKSPDGRFADARELADALRATGLAEGWTRARAEAAWEAFRAAEGVDGSRGAMADTEASGPSDPARAATVAGPASG